MSIAFEKVMINIEENNVMIKECFDKLFGTENNKEKNTGLDTKKNINNDDNSYSNDNDSDSDYVPNTDTDTDTDTDTYGKETPIGTQHIPDKTNEITIDTIFERVKGNNINRKELNKCR